MEMTRGDSRELLNTVVVNALQNDPIIFVLVRDQVKARVKRPETSPASKVTDIKEIRDPARVMKSFLKSIFLGFFKPLTVIASFARMPVTGQGILPLGEKPLRASKTKIVYCPPGLASMKRLLLY